VDRDLFAIYGEPVQRIEIVLLFMVSAQWKGILYII